MILALLYGRVQLFLYPALVDKVGQHFFETLSLAAKGSGYLFECGGVIFENFKNFFLARVGERIIIYIIIYIIYVPKSVPKGVGRCVPGRGGRCAGTGVACGIFRLGEYGEGRYLIRHEHGVKCRVADVLPLYPFLRLEDPQITPHGVLVRAYGGGELPGGGHKLAGPHLYHRALDRVCLP